MPDTWGRDLHLLADLRRGASRDRGEDLVTRVRPNTGKVDLATIGEIDNLAQALLLRFLTLPGELAELGHPEYGCRLHELIGSLNNETTRNRAKMFTLQALAAEPRVDEVIAVTVTTAPADPTQIDIAAALKPVGTDAVLELTLPLSLEGG